MINEWERSVDERVGAAKIEVGEPFDHLDAYIIAKTEFGRNYEERKQVFEKLGQLQNQASHVGRYSRLQVNQKLRAYRVWVCVKVVK